MPPFGGTDADHEVVDDASDAVVIYLARNSCALSRSVVNDTAAGSRSTPMNLRPSWTAARPV